MRLRSVYAISDAATPASRPRAMVTPVEMWPPERKIAEDEEAGREGAQDPVVDVEADSLA